MDGYFDAMIFAKPGLVDGIVIGLVLAWAAMSLMSAWILPRPRRRT